MKLDFLHQNHSDYFIPLFIIIIGSIILYRQGFAVFALVASGTRASETFLASSSSKLNKFNVNLTLNATVLG